MVARLVVARWMHADLPSRFGHGSHERTALTEARCARRCCAPRSSAPIEKNDMSRLQADELERLKWHKGINRCSRARLFPLVKDC